METNSDFAVQTTFGQYNSLLNQQKVRRHFYTANISISFQFIHIFLQKKLRHYHTNAEIKKQRLNFKQIVVIAIALSTLLFAPKSNAENWLLGVPTSQHLMTQAPKRQPPLHLWLQTGLGVLVLIGLIGAYIANSTRKSQAIAATDAEIERIPDRANIVVSPQSASLLPHKQTIEEDTTLEHAELLNEITLRLQQSLDLEDLLRMLVKEVRRALKTDRVVVYAFNRDNWQGDVIAESVGVGLPQTLHVKIDDPCLRRHIEDYKKGRIRAINDINREPGLTECHIKLLEQFAVKANLVAPIVQNDELFGLLIAHQCDHPRVWHSVDIHFVSQLAVQLSHVMQQVTFLESQQLEAEQTQLIQQTQFRLRQSLDSEDLFKTAVKEIRRAIRTDRILIYQFDAATWQGTVVAESVASGLPQTWRVKIDDPCFRERHAQLYQQGRVRAINDIYHEPELSSCYIKLLEQFAVKASLVAPILQNDLLIGLVIAHQCDRPRVWQQHEINLFSRLANQVGFVMNQIVL